jgi:hypothetical protein
MPENLNHYRTALYLSAVVALTNCIVCGLSVFLQPQTIRGAIGLSVLSLAIPAGLWLGSNFVRFAGAVFLLLWGGFLLWPWISSGAELRSGQLSIALVFGFSAALSLVTAMILLLSRKFSAEFAEERKRQPTYKSYLRRGLLAAIIVAVVMATANDLYRLFLA